MAQRFFGDGEGELDCDGLKLDYLAVLHKPEDGDYRKAIEKELLKNRISYFLRWPKKSIFSRKNTCIICVHDDVKETASQIVQGICDDLGYTVRFMYRKAQNDFL